MINFNHLYYFYVTASEGSVKAAAERLGVTQPTVSEQLKTLERALGVILFERTPSGLQLTRPGRAAFEHSTAMFQAGQRLVEALGQATPPSRIALRIGISAAISRTIAADFLMPVLTLEECHPIIVTGDFNEHIRDLRAHELDLAIGETEPIDAAQKGLEIVTIHRPALVAIAGPSVVPHDDWHDLSMLEYRASSAYQWEIDAFLESRGLRPTPIAELDDAFLMLEAVAQGGMIAFVPKSVARDAIKVGRVKVLATLKLSNSGVYALYHQTEPVDLIRKTVEKLIEHARSQFDAE